MRCDPAPGSSLASEGWECQDFGDSGFKVQSRGVQGFRIRGLKSPGEKLDSFKLVGSRMFDFGFKVGYGLALRACEARDFGSFGVLASPGHVQKLFGGYFARPRV